MGWSKNDIFALLWPYGAMARKTFDIKKLVCGEQGHMYTFV